MASRVFRILMAIVIAATTPLSLMAADYIPSAAPEFYFVGENGYIATYMRHIYVGNGHPMTQYVQVDYSLGPVPGVTVGGSASDAYLWREISRVDGHVSPTGSASLYDYQPVNPGTGDGLPGLDDGRGSGDGKGTGGGAMTGIDPGYAIVGQFVLGVIRMNGDSNFLVAGVSTSAAQEIHQTLNKIGISLGQLNFMSNSMDKTAGDMTGTVVPLPNGFSNQVGSSLGPLNRVEWPEPPISFLNEHVLTGSKAVDQFESAYRSNDIDEMMRLSEMVATNANNPLVTSQAGSMVRDGTILVSGPSGQPGPFNTVKFQTSSESVYGKLVRRAANRTQLAWKKAADAGLDTHDGIWASNTSFIRIADLRLAFPNDFSNKMLRQAEAILYAADQAAQFAGGFGKGVKESLKGMIESIMAIPEMGEALYDYMKYAYKNPDLATAKAVEVLSKTPEFMVKVYDQALKEIQNFPNLSAAEQGKWIGYLSTEVVATFGTAGAGGALKGARAAKVAAEVAEAGRYIAPLRRKLGDIANKVRKYSVNRYEFGKVADFKGKFPELDMDFHSSFTRGKFTAVTALPDKHILIQVQNFDQKYLGKFFGIREDGIPTTLAEGEKMFNIGMWDKRTEVVKGFRVKKPLPGYFGGVEGGTGNQFVVPRGFDHKEYLEEIFEIRIGQ